jgi:diguanylate cyclase (GGDEF)-like protein
MTQPVRLRASGVKSTHTRVESDDMIPIEGDDHVRRARRTAAWTRLAIGVVGVVVISLMPELMQHPALGVAGFATIMVTAAAPLWARVWLKFEESLAAVAAILIIGLGNQQVTVLSILWLAAVATGVLARGGRVHSIGRTIVLIALALPVIREGRLTAEHAGLIVATLGLLLTIGRLTVELNNLLRQARWDADHDSLTGLLSRSAFRAALDVAGSESTPETPVSLLLFDLDGFGAINKTSGHATGDGLLAGFGELLSVAAADADGVAGRLGGDEFVLLLPGTDAHERAERLLDRLPQGAGEVRQISASVGIAQAPRDGGDAEALLRATDIALRVAKKSPGGGSISAYSGGSLTGDGRQSARGALRRVIDGDGLTMVVQPIVDVRSGSIHAYEALARFGADGSGSPLEWFSLADELGEREALERACLGEALELYCRRPRGTGLSVNLSAPVLLDRRTLRMLDQLPDLSGLIIEITEEALVEGGSQLDAVMRPLRARGASMAVDDMGAGYSGLGQIMAVHPSYLKLDRSLVTGIDSDHDRAALVAALVHYAERVGIKLVAEGMESEAELRTLIDLGVPLAQGFYLARPAAPWPSVPAVALALSRATPRVARAAKKRAATQPQPPGARMATPR